MQYLLTEEEYQEYKRLKDDNAPFNKEKLRKALVETWQSYVDTLRRYEIPLRANQEARQICKPIFTELERQGLI